MVSDLPAFNPSETDIESYIEDLENHMLAHHGQCNDDRKRAALMTGIGPEPKKVIGNFSADQKATYAALCVALKEHYKIKKHIYVERHAFYSMFMDEGELVDNYLTRLRTQAAKCDFRVLCHPATPAAVVDGVQVPARPAVYHNMNDEFIRDRLIVSINDNAAKTKLLQETNLTLDSAVAIVKATERANDELKRILEAEQNVSNTVGLIRKKARIGNSSPLEQPKPQISKGEEFFCHKYCGERHVAGKCPAFGKKCKECNKKGHFRKVCWKLKDNAVNAIDQNPMSTEYGLEEDTENLFLGTISCDWQVLNIGQSLDKRPRQLNWYESISLDGKEVECKIDTGAQLNVMSMKTYQKHFDRDNFPIRPTKIKLNAYNQTGIPCLGLVSFQGSCKGKASRLDFAVVPIEDVSTVLGLPSSIDFSLVNPPAVSEIATDNINVHSNSKSPIVAEEEKSDSTPNMNNLQISPVPKEITDKFPRVFDNSVVGMIKGDPYKIRLKKDAVPTVDAARAMPFALAEKVDTELKRMESLGVISKVEEPTEWVNSMAVVIRGEKVRICLDPKRLNDAIMREHIRLPTTDEMLATIGSAKVFSKLDLKDGYWQVPLDKESSLLTTFNSPSGRWRYKRLPFGLNSANEVFQKKVSQIFENLPGSVVLFDDILIFGKNEEEHDEVLNQALERCANAGLKLNPKKCRYKVSEVQYLGHIITPDGIRIDEEKVEAIRKMPRPTDRQGVQRLLGTLNQLSKFVPNLASMTQPIRELLNKNVVFKWSYEQEKSFDQVKQCLTTAPVLGYYDVNEDVTISCDASGGGLGACLLQKDRPITYASRSLTEIELSYSPIEKEMLGIVYACDRFYQFIYAKRVTVESDHQPFVDIFKKPFHSNPARLQRFLIRLQRYNLDVTYVPGKKMFIADMLSRAPTKVNLSPDELELQDDYKFLISTVIRNLNCSDLMRNKIIHETENDLVLSKVKHYIQIGWPETMKACHANAKVYWPERAELSYKDGYILYRDRIVIPQSLRAEILNRIHEGHQGQERCKMLARKAVYWRGITADIERVVSGCEQCLLRRKAPAREPLIPHEIPNKPWHKLACDIFSYSGVKYQILVDYFSKWVEVEVFNTSPSSKKVISHLEHVFCQLGFPKILVSDGDPLYTSTEFEQFCRKYGFDHVFSSAGHPRSNGQVERKIQFIKDLIVKSGPQNLDLVLLQYRNTPLDTNLDSPAKLLLNRDLRSRIPMIEKNYNNNFVDNSVFQKLQEKQNEAKVYHDLNATRERKMFKTGDIVRYRDHINDKSMWTKEGQITKAVNPRSYELVNSKGNVIRRNSVLLQTNHVPKMNATLPRPHDPLPQPDPGVQRDPPQTPCPGQLPKFDIPVDIPRSSNDFPDTEPVLRRSERIRNMKRN